MKPSLKIKIIVIAILALLSIIVSIECNFPGILLLVPVMIIGYYLLRGEDVKELYEKLVDITCGK